MLLVIYSVHLVSSSRIVYIQTSNICCHGNASTKRDSFILEIFTLGDIFLRPEIWAFSTLTLYFSDVIFKSSHILGTSPKCQISWSPFPYVSWGFIHLVIVNSYYCCQCLLGSHVTTKTLLWCILSLILNVFKVFMLQSAARCMLMKNQIFDTRH